MLFWTRFQWLTWEWHHAPWMFAVSPAALLIIVIVHELRNR